MSNVTLVIGIVAAAAIGIAYLSNMFCQVSGGVLCYPPAATSFLPGPPSTEGTPEEDIEAARNLPQSFTEAIANTIGGSAAKLKPIQGPQKTITGADFKSLFEAERRAHGLAPSVNLTSRFSPGGRLTPAQRTSACKASMGPSYCWSEGAGQCRKCGSTTGANFAESQAYYVRTA